MPFLLYRTRVNARNLESVVTVPSGVRDVLYWWIGNTEADAYNLIHSVEPELETFTDASLSSWGNGVESNGSWI